MFECTLLGSRNNNKDMIVKRKQYREIQYTKEAVEKYKSPDNLLRHAKIGPDVEGVMFVSKDKDELIGYCAWEGDYIVALEVVSEYRGNKFGEELLKRAIDSGCKKLSVNKNNIPAIELYKKFGFKKDNINLGPRMIEMELI